MLNTKIVAEIGTGHGGDLTKAKKLIREAALCGADIVKFQAAYADEILHPETGTVELPGGPVDLYRRFKATEKPAGFYEELKLESEKQGLTFLCTPFGFESARMLQSMDPRAFKIASPELNYLPLLEEVAAYGKPIILSTGVSRLADIEEALETIEKKGHQAGITLLHCVTSYPAREEEYNLNLLPHLSKIFGVPTGVSDHSKDPVLVPVAAVCLGALMVEKHFTLNKTDSGLDDPIALDPEEFFRMVQAVRKAELDKKKGLEELKQTYSSERVIKTLGSGKKELPAGEQGNYGYTNRTIHAYREIPKGRLLTKDDYRCLRSEKNLPPGLHPRYFDFLAGKRAVKDIPAGHGIRWDHLVSGEVPHNG